MSIWLVMDKFFNWKQFQSFGKEFCWKCVWPNAEGVARLCNVAQRSVPPSRRFVERSTPIFDSSGSWTRVSKSVSWQNAPRVVCTHVHKQFLIPMALMACRENRTLRLRSFAWPTRLCSYRRLVALLAVWHSTMDTVRVWMCVWRNYYGWRWW